MRLIYLLVFVLLTTPSCKKFVETGPPKSQLLGVAVFEDSATASAALSGLYASLRDEGILSGYNNNNMGFYADELVTYSLTSQSGKLDYYTNSILPTDPYVASSWNTAFKQIYMANAILEGAAASSKLSTSFADQLRGEALFVRCLLHFYLSNLFGAVPFIDTTNYTVTMVQSRIAAKDVQERIITDLHKAVSLMSTESLSPERVRPNRWVAKALLARVYLYSKNWEAAEEVATDIIDNAAPYRMEEDLLKIFLKESTETLWQFKPSIEGKNTDEGAMGILVTPAVPSQNALTEGLMAAFEVGDLRKTAWVGAFTEDTDTWYFPYKYKQRNFTPVSEEYSIIFRLAEQYLIRAEARAYLGQIQPAVLDLQVVRQRAGLQPVETINASALLDAIIRERQVELFYEFSHRWYDLKRTQKAEGVLGPIKPGWNPTDTLLPVPQGELLVNPNLLPQNPGYN